MKTCTKCNNNKDLSLFQKQSRNKDKLSSWCKSCAATNMRQRRKDGKAKKYFEDPLKKRNTILKKLYGIDLTKYNEMFDQQNKACLICESKDSFKYCVDHDHITGQIRGILCHHCNAGLGLFKDNIKVLNKAIEYLIK